MTLRVVVADDQALVRVGFRGIIDATPGFTVVGEAGNGQEAVEVTRRARPDVVLMDVRMPVMDGSEATRQITSGTATSAASGTATSAASGVRVLILTTFDLDEYVFAALRAGASGFLLKDTDPADLLAAIRVVAAGEALLAPSVTRQLIGEFARLPCATPKPSPDGGALAGLTEREVEVLALVARGMSNSEIADHLVISPATAKTHVAHLLAKLSARDRVQLVIIGYQTGLAKVS